MLKKHAWSKEKLLNSWIEDPIKCLEKCGISSAAISDPRNELKHVLISTDNISNKTNYTHNNDNKNSKQEYLKIFQFDSENIIARKMSGRYLVKKKDSSLSLKTNLNGVSSNHQTSANMKKHSVSQIIETDSAYVPESSSNIEIETSTGNEIKNKSTTVVSTDENNNCINCEICFCSFDIDANQPDLFVEIVCGHRFCRVCWEQ